MLGARANAAVRAEQGGDEAARGKTDALRAAWPREVVEHCDALLARPMSVPTYEALLTIVGWRAARDVPGFLRVAKKRPGRPRVLTGNEYSRRNRARARATQRAMRRLKVLHEEEFQRFYAEERRLDTDPQDSDDRQVS